MFNSSRIHGRLTQKFIKTHKYPGNQPYLEIQDQRNTSEETV